MSDDSTAVGYDPVLKVLIEWLTKMSDHTEGRAEAAITLNVGGMLVSGYITSARQFMLSHPLTDGFLEVVEREFKSSGVFTDDSREYIHLSRAKCFVPGHPPIPHNDDGVFWRGRLSEVSGFRFGYLMTAPVEPDDPQNA